MEQLKVLSHLIVVGTIGILLTNGCSNEEKIKSLKDGLIQSSQLIIVDSSMTRTLWLYEQQDFSILSCRACIKVKLTGENLVDTVLSFSRPIVIFKVDSLISTAVPVYQFSSEGAGEYFYPCDDWGSIVVFEDSTIIFLSTGQ